MPTITERMGPDSTPKIWRAEVPSSQISTRSPTPASTTSTAIRYPPPGAPWHTQNYSFDYGPVHYVGLESYINYDDWRSWIYSTESFTSAQLSWLDDDLAA